MTAIARRKRLRSLKKARRVLAQKHRHDKWHRTIEDASFQKMTFAPIISAGRPKPKREGWIATTIREQVREYVRRIVSEELAAALNPQR